MPIFALVDCNNFYASCERVFNPKLSNKPVVVLSNNDGCVIARSNEAKQLGIPMGAPYYQWKALCQKHKVHVFSSNYELYGDMSARVMNVLTELCPDIEIYSIDEAFLRFDGFKHKNLAEFATEIRSYVKQCTGIPVSVGFAPTKTLAKVANNYAKKHTTTGVFDLCDTHVRNEILSKFPVEDIWGVGRRIKIRLNDIGIETALQLRDADEKLLRSRFSVVMEKMIAELRGISCLPMESFVPKKEIMSSRSFGKPVTEFEEIVEAVSHYAATACVKLRKQKSVAHGIYVFIHTNPFKVGSPQYGQSISYSFIVPTDNTCEVIGAARKCLNKIFKKGFAYKKAGIMLTGLSPKLVKQYDLFSSSTKNENLMATLDRINQVMGKGSLFVCAEGANQNWKIKRQLISKRYTTQWNELMTVF